MMHTSQYKVHSIYSPYPIRIMSCLLNICIDESRCNLNQRDVLSLAKSQKTNQQVQSQTLYCCSGQYAVTGW